MWSSLVQISGCKEVSWCRRARCKGKEARLTSSPASRPRAAHGIIQNEPNTCGCKHCLACPRRSRAADFERVKRGIDDGGRCRWEKTSTSTALVYFWKGRSTAGP
ncbi:uncharacterized protein MYCFIDRAFT_210676 [Pseudocercospora fijiensis CIRAD86]|uniref:Uncharacterized protein n=1 Tax=Pseudocercospora fijiensis (strain CIRAD86) TaxID=383855 RepID=M2ZB13_PSEFD|nr:uncharacterized protein MYCFIDRAFT_210676 [Pseudocercospora fijiensis CIRAD86]EME87040.1 hypothetical protein MYCFIDRAFT_210676 [Pseudocercospora fijiensis CIRAD86]